MKRIGLAFTGVHDDFSIYLESAKIAEELGYESYWISEDYFLRDTMTLASPVAAQTDQLDIGIFVNPYTRSPALTAMSAASLNEIAGGNVKIGMGAGPPPVMEQIVDYESPLWTVKEGVDIVRALLTEEEMAHQGDQFDYDGITLGQCSYMPYLGSYEFPQEQIPIYVAAVGPQMLKMAGDVGDGLLISVGFPPALAEYAIERAKEGLAMRDRDRAKYDIAGLAFATKELTDRARQFAALTIGVVHDAEQLINVGFDEEEIQTVTEAFQEQGLSAATDVISDELVESFVVTEANYEQWLDEFTAAGVDVPILLYLGPEDPESIVEMGASWARET